MNKKKIGIIGATGYTGSELVRLLVNHPNVEIAAITSESRAGEKFSDVHNAFSGIVDMELLTAKDIVKHDLDLVFLALPHGVSMNFVKEFNDKKFKIIDLSGDFRLSTPEVYKEWYKIEHSFTDGFDEAVYGSPELFYDQIKDAGLVANPGCFPTSALLGLAPILNKNIIETKQIIIDSKSGVTGAGIKPKVTNMFSNVNDNFKAYGIKYHRHTIEIEEKLKAISGEDVSIQFTPHLLPVDRGILTTMYARPVKDINEDSLNNLYSDYYKDAPFIRLRSKPPALKDVRGTNYCDIYPVYDNRTGMIIVITVIDNLVKGAAGQAIHNMNIMFGFDQCLGLNIAPLNP